MVSDQGLDEGVLSPSRGSEDGSAAEEDLGELEGVVEDDEVGAGAEGDVAIDKLPFDQRGPDPEAHLNPSAFGRSG